MDNVSEAENTFYDAVILKEEKTKEDVITYLAKYLFDKGYVNEHYCNATLERENKYPTGLSTKPVGIAVPHSNPENVIKEAVIVAVSENLVEFTEMGNSNSQTKVGIIFLLALKGENNQLNYLKNIVNYFKQKNNVVKFRALTTKQQIKNVLMKDILKI